MCSVGRVNSQLPGWKRVSLENVCEIVSGSTPKSGVAEYWNGDITWITPTDLGQLTTEYINSSQRAITQKGYDSCSTTLVPPDSVVMSTRAPIGHIGIARVALCTNQGCKTFVPGENVDTEFLYFTLFNCLDDIKALGSGAVFHEVSKTRLSKFEIPLPPLSEQKRIAAILNDHMADIAHARTAAEAQLEAAEALSAAYLRKTFKSKDAQEWRWPQLKEIAGINPRRPRGLKRPEEAPTTFVPMPSVDGTSGNISDPLERPFGEIKKGYTYFEENDVLFAKITPCMQNGKHVIARNLIDGIGFGTTEFHVIRSGDEVIPEWIHLYIRQPLILNEAATHFTGSVGQQRVPPYFLEDLAIPLPPLPEQKRIAAILNNRMADITRACTAIREKLETINQLPSAILRKAFNGEL